jgi:hypothetical protein
MYRAFPFSKGFPLCLLPTKETISGSLMKCQVDKMTEHPAVAVARAGNLSQITLSHVLQKKLFLYLAVPKFSSVRSIMRENELLVSATSWQHCFHTCFETFM